MAELILTARDTASPVVDEWRRKMSGAEEQSSATHVDRVSEGMRPHRLALGPREVASAGRPVPPEGPRS